MTDASESRLPKVICLCGSAGSLEPLKEFFEHVPASGVSEAFVVVTHMAKGQVSLLPEILAKHTALPIEVIRDDMTLAPGHVYVSSSKGVPTLTGNRFHVAEGTSYRGLPIDGFLRSTAASRASGAIAVILSGSGSDGALGLTEIKAQSGLAIAQTPDSAAYDGMPRAAIATGLVDQTLTPDQMYAYIAEYLVHDSRAAVSADENTVSALLAKIFVLLQARTGHDFSHYKTSTMQRRIGRRMSVHRIEELSEYVDYLRENRTECDRLFRDLLIGVTSFFRDPEAFDALATTGLRPLIRRREAGDTLRVWVPGCSTGEEAYSLAVLLLEEIDKAPHHLELQVFATDLDPAAIQKARNGVFPEGIAADLTSERLQRYFVPLDHQYRIREEVRRRLVFATQNVISDPPFTRLDVISCRNVLIYLDGELQRQLLPMFRYALKDDGILFLGSSESLGNQAELFTALDKKSRVFEAKRWPQASRWTFPTRPGRGTQTAPHPGQRHPTSQLAHQLLLDVYVPAAVIVNDLGDIVHVHGRTGRYLEPASGEPTLNVLKMARRGLGLALAAALREAASSPGVVERHTRVQTNDHEEPTKVRIQRISRPEAFSGLFLVSFHPYPENGDAESSSESGEGSDGELERELLQTRETLQTTIEELETSNEELKSANEELQSTNEELESSNEELETSKEELQSLNEELQTVNNELREKVEELGHANDDMKNLLNSTDIATVFLDRDLRVKRFTAAARKIMPLIQSDIGRPLSDLVSELETEQLEDDAREVLDTLVPKESEVRTREGLWYRMRVLPYRTTNDVIEGLVVTFIDVTELRTQTMQLHRARSLERELVEGAEAPTCLLTAAGIVKQASPGFAALCGVSLSLLQGRNLFEVARNWDQAEVREVLDAAVTGTTADDTVVQLGDGRSVTLSARGVGEGHDPGLVVLQVKDAGDADG